MDNWVGYSALAISILVGITGYFSRPTFVTASRATQLQDIIDALREENDRLKSENEVLRVRNHSLLADKEFWQDEYQKLKGTR